jgi:folate-binding protein YgfZ
MTDTSLKDRSIIRLFEQGDGEDVREFLQGLVTQDTRKVAPGAPQYGALLTAQGKVMFDFLLWADTQDDTAILIDCEAQVADALAKRLTLYRLRRKINIARDDALTVHWSADEVENGTVDPRLASLGYRWLDNAANGDASPAYHAHRLSCGVPEGQAEMGDLLWLECNAIELNGVAFDKGCYVGQENTARMNWRQKINRRLVVLPLAQSDPKRQRVTYPDLGLAVDHRRTEDLMSLDLPEWQNRAIKYSQGEDN